jgi:hypothetical protein
MQSNEFSEDEKKAIQHNTLAATISGIRDRSPGLKLYQHIYNDSHELNARLQAKIVSAYGSFIEFSIAITKYYKIGGPCKSHRAFGTW